jgi:hypothetical protein
MVNKKSHARDKSVTHFLPVLIPAGGDKPEGVGTVRMNGPSGTVFVQDGISTRIQPVRQFRRTGEPASRRFSAIAKLFSLRFGKKIDYSLLQLQETFRTLLADVSGTPLADATSKQAIENPKKVADRWLLPLFNQEIRSARLVMWWSPRKLSLVPAVFCPDRETALFVDLLFSGVTACLGCGKLFTPHRPNQLYHDFLCANRHRKRRERRRASPTVRGKTKGTKKG